MAQELGGTQISALLETVPGIASVLRSPVADALASMIRAGAGIGEFRVEDTSELIQYAVRRGLMGMEEGERLTGEVQDAQRRGRGRGVPRTPTKEPRKASTKAPKHPTMKKAKAGKKRRA
jgi:hypothetical protein